MVFVLTAAMMAFGSASWSQSSPPPLIERISLLPMEAQVPPPEPEPEPKPEPKPKPVVQKKPVKPAEPEKPDIALKKKKREEERKKKEAEKKRKAEEKRKRELAEKKRRKKEREQKLAEEKRKKREQERQAREKERLAQQRAKELQQARGRELAKISQLYESRIRGRIETQHSHPPSVPRDADIEVVVVFRLAPHGRLAELDGLPRIEESSGNDEYDESVLRAILEATPFPFPLEPELISRFSVITLRMTPEPE